MAENSKVLFAISKKGEKQPLVKTAAEILQDKDVISSMKPTDAHTVGYNLAMEDMHFH